MGAFYTNITLHGPDQEQVIQCLIQMKRTAYVSPTVGGYTVVYDEETENQDDADLMGLASQLSRALECPALAALVHDSDIFAYWLFKTGTLMDEYDSAPGYSNTSRYPARPNSWTGISYSRAAHQLMEECGVEYVFLEYEGGHLIDRAGQEPGKFIRWMLPLRRDPYAERVVAITPRGSWRKDTIAVLPSPRCRWISINETGEGTISYDKIILTGPNVAETMEQYEQQGYRLEKTQMPGGIVEAELKGDNVIDVKTENVRSFSIWLHPAMIDFSHPLTVTVDGRRDGYRVRASLVDALRSYKRRKDWGLIYHAELVIEGRGAPRRASSPD